MNRSISNNVAANFVRPCRTRRISRAVFMAFAALSLSLAVGCGGDDDDKKGGETPGNTTGTKYPVTVDMGTGSGEYADGATVTITANPAPIGQEFHMWEAATQNVTFANPNSATTTFTMPASLVSVHPNYRPIVIEHDAALVLPAGQAWVQEPSNTGAGYIFNSDGTHYWGMAGFSESGAWRTSGNKLYLGDGILDSYTYSISGGTLTLSGGGVGTITYVQKARPSDWP